MIAMNFETSFSASPLKSLFNASAVDWLNSLKLFLPSVLCAEFAVWSHRGYIQYYLTLLITSANKVIFPDQFLCSSVGLAESQNKRGVLSTVMDTGMF